VFYESVESKFVVILRWFSPFQRCVIASASFGFAISNKENQILISPVKESNRLQQNESYLLAIA